MPEGNEIHRWAERHTAAFGDKVVRIEAPSTSRFVDAPLLDGRVLKGVRAVGKHLGYDFGKDRILHVHLGMYGDWTEGTGPLPPEKGALRVRIFDSKKTGDPKRVKQESAEGSRPHRWYSEDDGSDALDPQKIAWVELRGPTDCSVYSEAEWKKLEERLGPDPLNGDGAERFVEIVRSKKTPIAVLLMDQSVAAGVGNILRAELLHRARMNPFKPGNEIDEKTLKAMWKDLVPLMKSAMVDRRMVTTRPKDRPTKKTGSPLKEETHYVYRRQGKPCFVCGEDVKTMEMAGRNLFWCPKCQSASLQ
ncbi:MAG: Fpg/Nei family DNA glycosylase [Acidobacteria bacterium]|nr:Fpg/Nei family DNA glycosylase [Acidobacteriota bacterium]